MVYDCIVVGGGFAGLQAAIQLGRYKSHSVLVIDSRDGRSTLCRSYHNMLGYPEGVSGETLRSIGEKQAAGYGAKFKIGKAVSADKLEDGTFRIACDDGESALARTLLLATGVMDRFPPLPGMRECMGLTVYVCPDCDGYEVAGRRTLVLGSGDSGAGMAITLLHWTDRLTYVNHEQRPINPGLADELRRRGIGVVDRPARRMLASGDGLRFVGVELEDGTIAEAERAFLAFGGNEVRTGLAARLGAKLHGNGHIATDPRTKNTSVANVWAAGDAAAHSEQATIAMGEGAQAAIWIHKALLEMKKADSLRNRPREH